MSRKELNKAIDAFLSERRASSRGGGWAEVTDQDEEQLDEIVRMLVELKCETDADGDLPFEWTLVNRRKFERSHVFLIPYTHYEDSASGMFDALSNAQSNARMWGERFDTLFRIYQDRLRREEKKKT